MKVLSKGNTFLDQRIKTVTIQPYKLNTGSYVRTLLSQKHDWKGKRSAMFQTHFIHKSTE